MAKLEWESQAIADLDAVKTWIDHSPSLDDVADRIRTYREVEQRSARAVRLLERYIFEAIGAQHHPVFRNGIDDVDELDDEPF